MRTVLFWIVPLLILPTWVLEACSLSPDDKSETRIPISGETAVAVDLSSPVRTMRGGIGASWHAIEQPKPGREGGSAWGANPPAEDDAAWQQIYRHARWLGLDWCRVEVEQRMYQPQRDRFDWDNPEMRILYRILDYCQRHGVDVFLTQMWANVEWNTFPEWRDDPIKRLHSGPLSMEDFADGLATLMEYLVKQKGYSCIKWLCINNEPGHEWSWWQRPPGEPMPLMPGLAAVRKALDDRGVTVPLSAPDWTDLPPLEPPKIDFDHLIGAYDLHTYYASFDWRKGGYSMKEAEKRLADWADWAHARGKPLFLSEMGTMIYGWRDNPPGPATFMANLKDAQMIARGLAAGVDGFNRWSFINRGDLDGHWQLIDTWDIEAGRLREQFAPHPNSYFVFGLLPRFTAKRSDVLKCTVEGGVLDDVQRVHAAALRSPKGNLTVIVVNDADSAWRGAIEFKGLKDRIVLCRYRVTRERSDRSDLVIAPEAEFPLRPAAAQFREILPAASVTIYTTYKLAHTDAGIIAD